MKPDQLTLPDAGTLLAIMRRKAIEKGTSRMVDKVGHTGGDRKAMSPNKQTVTQYLDAFRNSDHKEILSCLTDDVEWVLPGVFHLAGKEAFDKEIENDAFVGSPTITHTRMIEEHDVVVAEGTVRAARRDGGVLNAVFCDVFVLREAKIRHLTSYLMEIKA